MDIYVLVYHLDVKLDNSVPWQPRFSKQIYLGVYSTPDQAKDAIYPRRVRKWSTEYMRYPDNPISWSWGNYMVIKKTLALWTPGTV